MKRNHTIVIRPGERIPVDAVVTTGTTTIDTKAVTGESMPVSAGVRIRIYSGCINLSAVIEARVQGLYGLYCVQDHGDGGGSPESEGRE